MLWKRYFGLLRDHFGHCAMEELGWATQGSLWPEEVFGLTLASVLWKRYFGLLTVEHRDHFGQRAVQELNGATHKTL